MFVVPSIDILNGKCVQLINGRIDTAKIYGTPKEYFNRWVNQGADLIHIIDLNAVFNLGSNKNIIFKLLQNGAADVQVGGGIRDEKYAYELIKKGTKRIIIGTRSLDIGFLEKLSRRISKDKIMAALDTKFGCIVIDGWQVDTGVSYEAGLKKIKQYVGSILSTDVSREGLLEGPNSAILHLVTQGNIPVYVSGGFTTKKDIEFARRLGFSGVIIGKALYEEKLNLMELW